MSARTGMPSGRPKQPAKITALHSGKVPKPGPKVPDGALDPPGHLTPYAAEFWREYAPKLVKMGTFGDVDPAVFEQMCESYSTIRRGRDEIARDGDIIVGPRGRVRHPAHIVVSATLAQFHAAASQYGMTPAARARIVAPPADEPGDDLLSGFSR